MNNVGTFKTVFSSSQENHHKGNSISVGLRFSTIENAKIVCLESSDIHLMMTESTILFIFLFMFNALINWLISLRKSIQSLHDSRISHTL